MKFYNFYFLIISGLLFLIQTTLLSTTIQFEEHKIKLLKPIIYINDNEFIPIFELKSMLDLNIKKSHKFNGYYLKFNSNTLLLSINTNEVWLNNTRHFLIEKVIIKNGTVYAPLKDTFNLLGLTFSKKNDTYIVKKHKSHFASTNPYVKFQRKHIDSVRYKFKQIN